MENDLSNKAFYVEFVRNLQQQAASVFLKEQVHHPLALLLVTKHPETKEDLPGVTVLLAIPDTIALHNQNDEDRFSAAVRDVLTQLGGVGYVMIHESWIASAASDREVIALTTAQQQQISAEHLPGSEDVLLIHAEHRSFGLSVSKAKIKATPSGRELLPFEELGGNFMIGGSFSDLLPAQTHHSV